MILDIILLTKNDIPIVKSIMILDTILLIKNDIV
jgi:hypothetical protein